ncbi:hypothetical protein TNCV_1924981 [Trichonephila clavipes]|nr:hypothetical protein TNCV_1924981 [Trichonephila clavipes]
MTSFELLFSTKMKSCQDIEIVRLLNDETTAQFHEQRDALRQDAKKQIYKVQDENRRTVEQSTLMSHPVRNVRLKDTRETTQTDVRDA